MNYVESWINKTNKNQTHLQNIFEKHGASEASNLFRVRARNRLAPLQHIVSIFNLRHISVDKEWQWHGCPRTSHTHLMFIFGCPLHSGTDDMWKQYEAIYSNAAMCVAFCTFIFLCWSWCFRGHTCESLESQLQPLVIPSVQTNPRLGLWNPSAWTG